MRFLDSRSISWILVAAALDCSNGSTAPEGMGRVVFQIATTSSVMSSGPAAADVVVTKGPDELVINQVQLVARKIRLRRSDGTCTEDPNQEAAPAAVIASGRANDENGQEDANDDADCPVLKLGPLLLEPPLTDGAVTSFTADVPIGTYTRLRLQIHKPRGSNDQAFIAAHPEFADISIRVKGTFNGAPFTFDTNLTEEEEITLPTPVEVTAAGSTAFTLFLDVRGWFLDQAGAALVNPTTASFRSLIEHNIRSSFRAFEDADHNGEDDEHEGH